MPTGTGSVGRCLRPGHRIDRAESPEWWTSVLLGPRSGLAALRVTHVRLDSLGEGSLHDSAIQGLDFSLNEIQRMQVQIEQAPMSPQTTSLMLL